MSAEPGGRLGLIAGAGDLPVRLAAAARIAGRDPLVLSIAGAAAPGRFPDCETLAFDLGHVGAMLQALREAGCRDVAFAGHVETPDWRRLLPDARGLMLLPRVLVAARRGDAALLRLLVETVEAEGFRVVGAEEILADLLIGEGTLGRVAPAAGDLADIRLAGLAAAAIGRLDAGQAAVVREGRVLALEAAEGTDALLRRVAGLNGEGRGGVLVKRPKPGQDRRVDLPTVGPRTVAEAAAANLAGIALAAGGALVLGRDEVRAAADRAGLFVVGVRFDDE